MNPRALCALLVMLLGSPAVRGWLESRMSLHMAVELPLLMLGGWTAMGAVPGRWKLLERIDADGLLSLTTAACILALWMVPAALDMAVMEPGVALLKYGQWIGAGALLRSARHRLSPVVAAFFLANSAWMTATAGLLYLDAEQQLCVNYLVDDQRAAGFALSAWGVALGAIAWVTLQPVLASDMQAPSAGESPAGPVANHGDCEPNGVSSDGLCLWEPTACSSRIS